jgi:hypothetical protein
MRKRAEHRKRSSAVRRLGRPRKFNRPSTSVTLTLPDDVIATLQAIDTDLSRAVVRAIQPLAARKPASVTAAHLTIFGDREAIIVLSPSRALREHTGVELVALVDGRAMLAFDDQMSLSDFELQLGDAIVNPTVGAADRAMFEELAALLRSARRLDGVSIKRRSIIVIDKSEPAANSRGEITAKGVTGWVLSMGLTWIGKIENPIFVPTL